MKMDPTEKLPDAKLVACEVCRTQIPISEAKSAEAVDYVMYFCGLNCYEKWKKQEKT